ncbi:minor capsid protein, partial [Staphylococcus aureus]
MTQAFIRGDKLDTLIEKVVKRMSVSKSNVARLVYTESAAYASKARIKTYEDLNVERYEVVATLDSRTSEICQSIDGKVFEFKDYEIGTTAPPFHVNCRTTTA